MLTEMGPRPGMIAVAMLGVLLAGCSLPPGGTPSTSPSPVAPTPSITARAAPAPDSTVAPQADADAVLRDNPIENVVLADRVRCRFEVRAPRPPLADRRLARHLRSAVDCLMAVWAEPLAEVGVTLVQPRIITYRRAVKTPCGTFRVRGAPAYYCSATATIYWPVTGDDGNEAYTFARVGYLALLAHEFGHHVQSASGVLAAYAARGDRIEDKADRHRLSRRLELQAQCFEGASLRAVRRSIDLSSDDRYQLEVWHSYTGDEDPPDRRSPDHGTSAAQVRWLERGLATRDLSRCSTWTAPAKTVR